MRQREEAEKVDRQKRLIEQQEKEQSATLSLKKGPKEEPEAETAPPDDASRLSGKDDSRVKPAEIIIDEQKKKEPEPVVARLDSAIELDSASEDDKAGIDQENLAGNQEITADQTGFVEEARIISEPADPQTGAEHVSLDLEEPAEDLDVGQPSISEIDHYLQQIFDRAESDAPEEPTEVIIDLSELESDPNEEEAGEISEYFYDGQTPIEPELALSEETEENIFSFAEQIDNAIEIAEPEAASQAETIVDQIEDIILKIEPAGHNISVDNASEDTEYEDNDQEEITVLLRELSEVLTLEYSDEEITEITVSFLEIKQELKLRPQFVKKWLREKGTREHKQNKLNSIFKKIKGLFIELNSKLGFIALSAIVSESPSRWALNVA